MDAQLNTLLLPSVLLWLDNLFVKQNNGFTNINGGPLKKVTSVINGYSSYASPYRQWVYDSSVVGAQVPSGVYKNAIFTPKGAGIKLNYNQGGAYLASDSSNVTANFSKKDVNVYINDSPLEYLFFENRFVENTKTTTHDRANLTDFVYPCVVIHLETGPNKTLDFCGNVQSLAYVRLVFLADSNYLYQNVCNIVRDSQDTSLPVFTPELLPFDQYGELRNGSFVYDNFCSVIRQNTDGQFAYVKEVDISPFSPQLIKQMGVKSYGAFIDVTLEILRYPH